MDNYMDENCQHARQTGDPCTNETLCLDCGLLRDIMDWDEWDRTHTKNCAECR